MNAVRSVPFTALLVLVAWSGVASAGEWRDFRGDQADRNEPVPAGWSVGGGASEGVAWSAELPGRGVSGPVVVDGRVIVTASDGPSRQRLHVVAYREDDGSQLWSRRFIATGRTFCHESSANAAPTPATDGERVYAFYSSNELVALDLDGRVQWIRCLTLDHPGVGNDVGMASSPVVVDGVVVVQAECQRNSFAIGVDAATGETVWELDRPATANWSTPLPLGAIAGQEAVLLQDHEGLSAVSAQSGEEIWRVELDCDGIPSTMPAAERLLAPSAGLTVLQQNADLAPAPLWQSSKLTPGSASAVATDDRVLIVNRTGVAVCGDLETGDILWRKRLGGRFWATPAVAGGRACLVNDQGQAWVLSMDDGRVLTEADFGQPVLASPAVAGGALYVRSYETLWKVVEPTPPAAEGVSGE